MDAVTGDPFRQYRDSGVIGEEKTLRPLKVYHEETTGSTFRTPDKGNFATPWVTDNAAKFKLGGKTFEFECLGWKYRIQDYWWKWASSSTNAPAENLGHSAHLESPDKKTLVHVSSVSLPVYPPLNRHSLTPEQERMLQKTREDPFIRGGTPEGIQEQMKQKQPFIEDPFVGEESRKVAQQAVEWYLNQNVNGFFVSEKDKPIRFITEHISGKEFVKAEFDIWNEKENFSRKSLIWAFNHRGFWSAYDGKRRAYTWICQIISDPSEYSSAVTKARQIPETMRFGSLKESAEVGRTYPRV